MTTPRASRSRSLTRRPVRLHVENLEDRVMLTAQVVEDFSSGNLNNYWTEYRYAPSAAIVPGASHDGSGNALDKADGFEWVVRTDAAAHVQQGETLSVWTQFAGAVDGRIYFGFGSQHEGLVRSPLSVGHTLALVLAGNTNQLMFMANDTSAGFSPAPHQLGTAAPQNYDADHWYRMEVVWGTGGALTGNLYDSDGVTLLNSVTASETQITSGGIAFRGFGSDKYFDTVTVDPGNSGPAQYRNPAVNHRRLPSHTPHTPPPPDAGVDTTGTPVPFDYTSAAGSHRDVALFAFDQLTQINNNFFTVNGQTKVGLAAENVSEVEPNSNEILWGPNSYNGTGDVIVETPYLAQYIFRQLPGQPTYLIGSSDIKHFFSSARSDYQHLNPGEQDTYVSSLNDKQNYFLPGAELNPVTGEMHNFDDFGPQDNDGFNHNVTRQYSSRLEYMLQVNVADLDPDQNPPGTRWFLMGNLWVAGDQDVSNNSRWVEFTPQRSGNSFTFTYPHGAGGQYDFRTIPGLAQGPAVLGQTTPSSAGMMDTVRVRFNLPINEATFTPDQVSLEGPGGPIAVQAVTPVAGSDDELFDVTFAPQTTLGNYSLTVGPDIQDQTGHPMVMAYTGAIALQGPQVTASTPAGAAAILAPLTSVRVTFNEPMDPATFTADQVDLFLGPNGRIPVTAITPVAGSNNTQFDIAFPAQGTTGRYTLVIGPDVYDLYGHALDQNNNFIPGEVPGDLYTVQFGIQGPQITTATALGSFDPGVFTVRVAFNEPIDPSTFTAAKVVRFTGPGGNVPVLGISPVAGQNNQQFDIFFTPQTRAGDYQLVIGPDVRDPFGNEMDQNGNLIPGETPDDQFMAGFTVLGPRITTSSPSGVVTTPPDHVHVVFNQPIDVTTFTPDQVQFTGPDGSAIPVSYVQAVPGTRETQFDVYFDAQTDFGTYTMVIGPGVQDVYGNPMRAAYVAGFAIQAPFTYTATAGRYHAVDNHPRGWFPMLFQNGTYYADDDFGTIDLGGDTFNFAGSRYTGANQLFVSSNGLITFGSGNSSLSNSNLNTTPAQAAIAPLWSDWVKTANDGFGAMIQAKFETTRSGERLLIVEWNHIRHYSGNNHLVTFQVILALDTGATPGAIVFNYVDITTGDGNSDGRTATVGIKDAGTGRRLLVSFNQINPLVGSQEAVRILYAAGGTDVNGSPDGLPVLAAEDASLAVASSVPAAQPAVRTSLVRGARTAAAELAVAALDQVFASPQAGHALPTAISARPVGRTHGADGFDPLTGPLEGQPI